jgi:hypothetical protein
MNALSLAALCLV